MGIRIPEDVSVVGFFDFAAATQIVPQLTTIRIPQEEIGVALVRCLISRMTENGRNPKPATRSTLMGEFVERRSAGPPGPANWARRYLRVDKGTVVAGKTPMTG
jgi:LacI family transcriptional regulator